MTASRLPHRLLPLALLLLVAAAPARAQEPPAAEGLAPPPMRGLGLTLHSKDPSYDYGPLLAELPPLGATHVLVIVHFYQRDGASPEPARHPVGTPSDRAILRVIRQARALGLRVGLLPILLLEAAGEDEWRGNLQPADARGRRPGEPGYTAPDWDRWFAGYGRELLHFARLAEEGGAELFSVGSELSSTEAHERHWRTLIAEVRRAFSGRLTYSANWDHYRHVRVWRHLDAIGLSGYYELTQDPDPAPASLVAGWRAVRERLLDWRQEAGLSGRPLLFLEVGYTSQDGCASRPWDYTGERALDLAEQAACYRAFAAAWRGCPVLEGVFFYEWWGEGGPQDRGYTPRGKPALEELRRYFSDYSSTPRPSSR